MLFNVLPVWVVGKSSICGNHNPAKYSWVAEKVGEPAYLISAICDAQWRPYLEGKNVKKWHLHVDFELFQKLQLEFHKALIWQQSASPQVFGEELSATQTDLTHCSQGFLPEALLGVYYTFAADWGNLTRPDLKGYKSCMFFVFVLLRPYFQTIPWEQPSHVWVENSLRMVCCFEICEWPTHGY